MSELQKDLAAAFELPIADEPTRQAFRARLVQGNLTRGEDDKSHFDVFFLPYHAATGEVFLVHHKKARTWLSPGGHIEKGETTLQALNREIFEELGVKDFFKSRPAPFFLSAKLINNPPQTCREHYDVWYLMRVEDKDFKIDPREFNEVRWVALAKMQQLVEDENTRKALQNVLNFREGAQNS